MIRVLVADDHTLVRQALVELLHQANGIEVAGEAANGDEVLMQVAQVADLDVVLLDLSMPGPTPEDVVQGIRAARAGMPVLVLSMYDESSVVSRMLHAGVTGYVAKGSDAAVLLEAIRTCAGGGHYVDPRLAEAVAGDSKSPTLERLSAREAQVLELLVRGLRVGDIADRLQLSAKTVSTHKMRLMFKLNIENNADLIRLGSQHFHGGLR